VTAFLGRLEQPVHLLFTEKILSPFVLIGGLNLRTFYISPFGRAVVMRLELP
jgi:hypothetical protein